MVRQLPRRLAALVLVVLVTGATVLAGCVGPSGQDDLQDAGTGRGDETGGNATPPADSGCAEPPCAGPVDGNATADPDVNESTRPETPGRAPAREPVVTIAVIDSGINPYHTEFRDDSALARQHPATYVPGYPEDAKRLDLSLDAPDLDTALDRDMDKWMGLEDGALYWVPGTRIVGIRSFALDGDIPGFDEDGHGTMTASRAAGKTTSLAPTARIVALEGLSNGAVAWAASQSWIDVQTNSWVTLAPHPPTRATFQDASAKMPVLTASGNGLAQLYGGAGQPSVAGDTQGAPGVISVGGHDNGEMTFWSGTVPHVVADACYNWAADASTMDRTAPDVGTGTSSATPYVAGAVAALTLEAKRVLGAFTPRASSTLVESGPAATAALPAAGPLADGALTLDELKSVLYATADPRPAATEHDGASCGPGFVPYSTVPVPYSAVPEDVPLYYFVGYGAVNVDALAHAKRVLLGEEDAPARATEDAFFATDGWLRQAASPLG